MNCGYQGRLIARNIEAQLRDNEPDADELEALRWTLDEVKAWGQELWQGQPLLASAGETDPSPDAPRMLELMDTLHGELKMLPRKLRRVLATDDLAPLPGHTQLLVTALGRHAYSEEHYLTWQIRWEERFGTVLAAKRWRQQLPAARESVAFAHECLEALQGQEQPDQEIFARLHDSTLMLPGHFAARLHDMAVLMGQRNGQVSYETAGIPGWGADAWRRYGIEAVPAGYWNAYGFTPQATQEWGEAGFVEPAVAAQWMVRGFAVADAARWANAGFSPTDARRQWDRGRRSPRAARVPVVVHQAAAEPPPAAQKVWPESVQDDGWQEPAPDEGGWTAAGFPPEHAEAWQAQGFDRAEDAKSWIQVGIAVPVAARAWRDRGFKSDDAALFTSLQEYKAWRADGLSKNEAVAWKQAGCALPEVKHWREAGIRTIDAVEAWKQARIDTPHEAGEWLRAGYDPGRAREWLTAGYSSEEALDWLRHGFATPEDANGLRTRGHSDPAAARRAMATDSESLEGFVARLLTTALGSRPRQVYPLLGDNHQYVNGRFPAAFRKVASSFCPGEPANRETFAHVAGMVVRAVHGLPAGNPKANARVGEQCFRILAEILGRTG